MWKGLSTFLDLDLFLLGAKWSSPLLPREYHENLSSCKVITDEDPMYEDCATMVANNLVHGYNNQPSCQ